MSHSSFIFAALRVALRIRAFQRSYAGQSILARLPHVAIRAVGLQVLQVIVRLDVMHNRVGHSTNYWLLHVAYSDWLSR
jgi:hypothetical protein